MFVSWLRRLVADLWHRKPRSVHLGLVDKVLGQVFFIGRVLPLTSDIITPLFHTHLPPMLYYVFLPAFRFFPVSIIQPLLHIHSFIRSPLTLCSEQLPVSLNLWISTATQDYSGKKKTFLGFFYFFQSTQQNLKLYHKYFHQNQFEFTIVILFYAMGFESFRSHYGPGIDSASNRNEYQESFRGVKTAGA